MPTVHTRVAGIHRFEFATPDGVMGGRPACKPWDAGTDSDTCIQIAAAPTDHDGKPVWTGQTDSKGNNNAAFACATALMAAANSEAEGIR